MLSKQVTIGDAEILVSALLVERSNSTQVVRFYWEDSRFTFSEILDALGVLPIPPYLNRSTEAVDLERYMILCVTITSDEIMLALNIKGLHLLIMFKIFSGFRVADHSLPRRPLHDARPGINF